MRSFREIAEACGTDKVSLHGYDRWYPLYFEELRNEPLSLLEIGIYRGASLRLWEEYFPKAKIYGIEYDPALASEYKGRAKVFVGRQEDQGFLETVYAETGPLQLVIDDGGHMWGPQQVTCEYFWPRLDYRGYYVVEDLHTANNPAYREKWRGVSTFWYLHNLYGRCLSDDVDVEAVHFHPKICFARRKPWSGV